MQPLIFLGILGDFYIVSICLNVLQSFPFFQYFANIFSFFEYVIVTDTPLRKMELLDFHNFTKQEISKICLIFQCSKHIVKLNYYSHPRNLFLDKRSFLSSSVRRSSTALTQNATEVQVVTSDRQAGPYVPHFPKIPIGSLGFGNHHPCT